MSRCRGPGRVAGAGVVDGSRCAVEPATHCIGQGRGRGGGWRTHARSQSVSQSETRLRHRLTPKASARHSHRETNGIGRLCVRRLTPAYTIECGMVDARRAVAVINP